MSIFTVWRLWISERRLAIDNGFNSAIQEILHVEGVIFTSRSRVLIPFLGGAPILYIAFSDRTFVSPKFGTICPDFGTNVPDLVQIVQCL